MQKYNAEGLLYSRLNDDRFINKLDIKPEEELLLNICKEKVRKKTRSAFSEIKSFILENKQNAFLDSVSDNDRQLLLSISPLYKSQGSTVYGTLNDPVYVPPQQIDADDGIYIPMSVVEDNPVIKKNIFFDIVDGALKELVKEEGWKGFDAKNTCSRLIVNQRIHIDVPLYAIPDERFNTFQMEAKANLNEELLIQNMWLDQSEVYLAVRDQEHWIKSDPAKIQRWFQEETSSSKFGPRLIRVCRYLKAWRDYTWKSGGPSSITLMICAWETFCSNPIFESDSEALYRVAKELPSKLSDKIYNPGDKSYPKEEVYPRNTLESEQQKNISHANNLYSHINSALVMANNAQQVVERFQDALGDRIPNKPDVIIPLSVAPYIRKQKAHIQPKPTDIPPNLQSG